MKFDQSSSMHSAMFWIPQTSSSILHNDNTKKCNGLFSYNKKLNGASSLNRNFGSTIFPKANRYPIRHVSNAFNYLPTNLSNQSKRLEIISSNKNHFDFLPKYKLSISDNNNLFNTHSLSYVSAPTYNTVHTRKPIDDALYDTTAEEYEDLDSYEKLDDRQKNVI